MTISATIISIQTALLIAMIIAYIKAMGDTAAFKREIEILKRENEKLQAENREYKAKIDVPPACAKSEDPPKRIRKIDLTGVYMR